MAPQGEVIFRKRWGRGRHTVIEEDQMKIPSEQSIRERAYQLWEQDGRPDGRSVDYWLRAARDLEDEATAPKQAPAAEKPRYAAKKTSAQPTPPRAPKRTGAVTGGPRPKAMKTEAPLPTPVRNAP
jgi:hypothetical protein